MKWFDRCENAYRESHLSKPIFCYLVLSVGFIASAYAVYFFKPRLAGTNLAFHPDILAMFFPPTFAVITAGALTITHRSVDKITVLVSLGAFVLLGLIMGDLLPVSIIHTSTDDSAAYSRFARYIVANRTLQGGNDTVVFYLQPGFRYVLAGTILLFGDESRLTQMAHTCLIVIFFLFLYREITKRFSRAAMIGAIALATCYAPFMIKSCLMSYSEWLTVILFGCFVMTMLNEHYLIAALTLGISPFFRQNLIVLCLILFGYCLANLPKGKRFSFSLLFCGVLLLPLYHNIYYAGEWRFLATQRPQGALTSGNLPEFISIVIAQGSAKLLHYIGYYRDRFEVTIFGLLFAPASTLLFLGYWLKRIRNIDAVVTFSLITGATIGPTSIAGWGNYPRFIFVNLGCLLLCTWLFSEFGNYLPIKRLVKRSKA